MPTVSVIVPVYQADEYIDECLASIKAQDYKDYELIVVDDPQGSGAAVARNRGLARAKGKYVMFVDADDYLAPGAIGKIINAIHGVDMVCGSFRKFGDFDAVVRGSDRSMEMAELAGYVMDNLAHPMNYQMLSGCWAKLYRMDMVSTFPHLATAEDMAFNYTYLRRCDSVRFLSDIVYHNRKHKGSLTTTFDPTNRDGLFCFLEGLKRVKAFLLKHYSTDEVEKAIDNSKVYHSMLYYMRICEQEGGSMRYVLKRLYQ